MVSLRKRKDKVSHMERLPDKDEINFSCFLPLIEVGMVEGYQMQITSLSALNRFFDLIFHYQVMLLE